MGASSSLSALSLNDKGRPSVWAEQVFANEFEDIELDSGSSEELEQDALPKPTEEGSSDEVESPGEALQLAVGVKLMKSRFSIARGPISQRRISSSGNKKKAAKKTVWLKIDPVPFADYTSANKREASGTLRPQGYALEPPAFSRVAVPSESDGETGAGSISVCDY